MELLEQILKCSNAEEVDNLITKAINSANENSTKVGQLGFLEHGKSNSLFRGFIPLNTRIKYMSLAIETYSMETTDYFYDFAHFIRKYNINNKAALIYNLEFFINSYFGYPGKIKRDVIFQDIAWQNTKTDEEFWAALENNKIGDLKGTGAAECTERGALAQQILSLFGIETYYCMGCVDLGDRQEFHCFNVVKRKNDYALLDYSITVPYYNQDGTVIAFYPFVGTMSNEDFETFVNRGVLKTFDNYEFVNNNEKRLLNNQRSYIVGVSEILREDLKTIKK